MVIIHLKEIELPATHIVICPVLRPSPAYNTPCSTDSTNIYTDVINTDTEVFSI